MSTSSLLPWVAVALFAHGAALAASDRPAPPEQSDAPPLEVELGPAPLPEPAAAPEPVEEEHPSEPVPVARPAAKTPRSATPAPTAAAAKIGALLTFGETADSADPVAFFSDSNGGEYGSGVVAHGGQAAHGVGPAVAAPVPAPSTNGAPGDGLTPAANLSRAPSLDEPDACRGFFPAESAVDVAKVDLVVIVQGDGTVRRVTIARESPEGEGFGQAARACLLSKRFTPGADRAGRPVAASTAVRVHFTR